MMTFYLIGVVIIFVCIFILEAYIVAHPEEYTNIDVLGGLMALIIWPWFSWILIGFLAVVGLFVYLSEKRQ